MTKHKGKITTALTLFSGFILGCLELYDLGHRIYEDLRFGDHESIMELAEWALDNDTDVQALEFQLRDLTATLDSLKAVLSDESR